MQITDTHRVLTVVRVTIGRSGALGEEVAQRDRE